MIKSITFDYQFNHNVCYHVLNYSKKTANQIDWNSVRARYDQRVGFLPHELIKIDTS